MPAFWYQPGPTFLSTLLAPLGAVYGWAASRHGVLRAARAYYAAVPVISIGNLVVGGAGKTPLVEALAAHYAAHGHQVAIVSRGYGGKDAYHPTLINPRTHSARQVGDEPLMLARQFEHNPVQVWVGRARPAVVQRAEQAGATLIILDDGFQRRDVARHANVLVIDGSVGFGNGQCLPAGPLREGLSARLRADVAVIINPPAGQPNYLGLTTYRLGSQLNPGQVRALAGKPVVAFAGLAHPEKFFNSLGQAGLTLAATCPYPDHHVYTKNDLTDLKTLTAQHRATLVCTAKDAVKLPPGFAQVLALELTGPDWHSLLVHLKDTLRRS